MNTNPRRAFTLIELLIVVAIIAILAAIAVPNFLEAQTRAKVSRVKADMRTLATGIEAYTVDYNKPPFDWAEDVLFPYYIHAGLSTPVSYLSNGRLTDAFADRAVIQSNNQVRERFRYRAFEQCYLSPCGGSTTVFPRPFAALPGPGDPGIDAAIDFFGAWFLASKGPDALQGPLPQNFADGRTQDFDWFWQLYDPTNGTISPGDLIRSHKVSDVNAVGYGERSNITYQ